MSMFSLIENAKVIVGAVPIDTTGAAVAGDYINMSVCERMYVIIMQGAWAGGTPAVTMTQGTTASGGSTAAFTNFRAWKNTALTDDLLASVTVAAGTFNLAATANQCTVLEANTEDMTDGYKFLRVGIASPGSNADLIAVLYICTGLRYQGEMPTAQIS